MDTNSHDFEGFSDDLALTPAAISADDLDHARQTDGPYRDHRALLRNRRETLVVALDRARIAAARVKAIEGELRAIDSALGAQSATPKRAARARVWLEQHPVLRRGLQAITLGIVAGIFAGTFASITLAPWLARSSSARVIVPARVAHAAAPSRREAIRWIAPNAWEIDRNAFDQAVLRPRSLARWVSVWTELDRDGIRIDARRAPAIIRDLGLRDADVIIDVNGVAVGNSSNDIGFVMRQLDGADALFVRLIRDGEVRVHVYRFVD